jgi:DNA replication licensing factor MCM2
MSEASARMALRDYVRGDDIDFAIGVMLESFIQSQKFTVGKQIKAKFSKYLNKTVDTNSVLLHCLERQIKEQVPTSTATHPPVSLHGARQDQERDKRDQAHRPEVRESSKRNVHLQSNVRAPGPNLSSVDSSSQNCSPKTSRRKVN